MHPPEDGGASKVLRTIPNHAERKGINCCGRWTADLVSAVLNADGLEQFAVRRALLRMLSVRNIWSGLDTLEKTAVVLAVVALTLAAWALGSLAIP